MGAARPRKPRARRRCAQTTALTTLTPRPCRSKHKECSLGREALQQPSRHGRGFAKPSYLGLLYFPLFGRWPLFSFFFVSPLSPAHGSDRANTHTPQSRPVERRGYACCQACTCACKRACACACMHMPCVLRESMRERGQRVFTVSARTAHLGPCAHSTYSKPIHILSRTAHCGAGRLTIDTVIYGYISILYVCNKVVHLT